MRRERQRSEVPSSFRRSGSIYGVILRIGDKFIKLGKDTKSLLLVQGIADRWNDREPLPRWLTMVDGG
jgi:hypothetical protein